MPTPPKSTCKLYVGNLSPEVKGEDLQTLFGRFGAVKWADIAVEPGTTKSRGFAFVMMESALDGRRAVNALNNSMQFGQMLKVNMAKPAKSAASPKPGGPRPRSAGRQHFRRRPERGR